MPCLLYPLLSLVLRKFLFTGGPHSGPPVYSVAFATDGESELGQWLLQVGRPVVQRRYPEMELPQITYWVADDPEKVLAEGQVDVVVRVTEFPKEQPQPGETWQMDCELLTLEGSISGERASRFVEDCFRAVSAQVLSQRLIALGDTNRATPLRAIRRVVKDQGKSSIVSLSALVPFVLIMMTITGAVYPAIDLTAGERERGTLELLIAAPVPRLGLLIAKYAAVLVVAMLTASVNLTAMAATVSLSGLGTMLWGEEGLSLGTMVAVFALLFLLASFFSAVLLVITSFARSFKEAQAYLIPLMLSALGPGLISLMPGVQLTGWLAVTPLLNVAILSRDLLGGEATVLGAGVAVISTLLYSFAALAVAARFFAKEGVLLDARLGWSDLWKRPKRLGSASITQALLCLACMFPVSFAALGWIKTLQDTSLSTRFVLMILATAVVYGGIPFLLVYWRRVAWSTGLSFRRPTVVACLGGVLLGLSLWPLMHELVVIASEVGLASLDAQQMEQAEQMIAQVRTISVWLFLAAIAIAPPLFEEFCFRGLVFGAFRDHWRPASAIGATGALFGVFHLVTSDTLAIERLLPSTVLGCVLSWVCWRSGSLVPSVLLHAAHNGLLALMIYYLPELKSRGWGIEEREHMPLTWVLAAAVGCAVGGLLIQFFGAGRTVLAEESEEMFPGADGSAMVESSPPKSIAIGESGPG
jgi:ABC-2 type transport system permease protein/sodium transport system permease protein